MESEEEKMHPVKNKKRTLKTPSQVDALENFYDEHKYPSESMKAQLAAELGLSEKQIQGWFCHRRSKDKKVVDEDYAIKKSELQSSVNDCASGVRHDSCSSSRQGEHLHDSKEVESHRFHCQAYPDSGSDLRKRYLLARNFSVVDDTSSGSSSASQDRLAPNRYLYGMKNLRHSSIHDEYENMNTKDRPRMQYMTVMDTLYMDEISEHPSIIAVKIKLGKMYCVDGPPLGIEFQPLPPVAFDSPLRDQVHEPYYMGNLVLQSSQGKPRLANDSHVGRMDGRTGNAFHASDSCLREPEHKKTQPSRFQSKYACDSPTWDPTNHCSQMSDMRSVSHMDGLSDSEASEFISNESEAWSRHGVKGMPIPNPGYQYHAYSGTINNRGLSFLQIRDGNQGRHSEDHVFQPHNMFAHMPENEVSSTKKLEKEKMHDEWRINKENDYPVKLSANVMRRKRNGGKICKQETTPKRSAALSPQMINPVKGYAVDIPTSFSEDEAEDTGSSIDK